jgi:3-oxoadipate enol-lactonase / 4-carboxymuconolactone decarboxylase
MPLIQANGVRLFYDMTGPQDAPPLLFSNSLGTTLEMWDEVVCGLAPFYCCIRYDTRGHGRSEVLDRPLSIDDLASDAAGLLDALGIARAHVIGLSIGGMTAQALAVAKPEKVASLTLMATSAFLPPASLWEERAQTVLKNGTAAVADATMERWFTKAFREAAPHRVERMRTTLLAISGVGYAACCRAIRDMDLRPRIGAISAPTLIVAGQDDPSTPPAMSEELKERIAGSELVVLSPAAHLLAIERADAVVPRLLSFLAEREGGRATPGGASFPGGLANRKAVLGVEHVERSLEQAGSFAAPWQEFITSTAWNGVWGDSTLPWKTRSLVTLAMMVALGREDEFKLHLRPALRNGVSLAELRALLMQTAIYGGVPAANNAFKWVRETLGPDLANH